MLGSLPLESQGMNVVCASFLTPLMQCSFSPFVCLRVAFFWRHVSSAFSDLKKVSTLPRPTGDLGNKSTERVAGFG